MAMTKCRLVGAPQKTAFLFLAKGYGDMKMKRMLNWLGVIVLGALGSGLWELLKPWMGGALYGILAIATFGLDSLRDGLYQEISSAYGNPGSSRAYFLLLLSILSCGLALVIHAIAESLGQGLGPRGRRSVFLFAVGGAMTLVMGIRAVYIERLYAMADQLLQRSKPFLVEKERLEAESRFAQIQSRADYVLFVESLTNVLKTNGQAVEDQSFF